MNQAWYHCGRCGSLFSSDSGLEEKRLCEECGLVPASGIWPINVVRLPKSEIAVAMSEMARDNSPESGRKAVRKKRKSSIMMKIIVWWIVAVIGLLGWKRYYDTQHAKNGDGGSHKDKMNFAKGTMADENIALLSRAMPDCHRALIGFLTGGAPEIRNQYVADPIETAGIMASFYKYNAFPDLVVSDLKRTGQQPIRVGDEWMIETRWNDGKGQDIDAVFRRYGAVWKLDWEHFSRYGDYSWPLFLAGEGPEEVEFRLLARKVSAGDKAEESGSRLRFTFLSPVIGKPAETGIESPEFIVNRYSEEGLLLKAAFDLKNSGQSVFGGTLPQMEPDNLIRVRVRIKRGEFAGLRSFELEELIACHWIGIDEPGFDLKKLKDDLFTAE